MLSTQAHVLVLTTETEPVEDAAAEVHGQSQADTHHFATKVISVMPEYKPTLLE